MPRPSDARRAPAGVGGGGRGAPAPRRRSCSARPYSPAAPLRVGQVEQRPRLLRAVAQLPRQGERRLVEGRAGRVVVGVVLDEPAAPQRQQPLRPVGGLAEAGPQALQQRQGLGVGAPPRGAVARVAVGVAPLQQHVEQERVVSRAPPRRADVVEEPQGLARRRSGTMRSRAVADLRPRHGERRPAPCPARLAPPRRRRATASSAGQSPMTQYRSAPAARTAGSVCSRRWRPTAA